MELLATEWITPELLSVTLADARGLLDVEASPLELAMLADAIEEAALLARASDRAAWLTSLPVRGGAVRLGIGAGRVRFELA